MLDPGFGFGKRFDENIPLLANFAEFGELGLPLLSGTSRKSFIGRTLARAGKDAIAEDRLNGTLATVVISVMNGAHIVRVHDVKPAVEAVKVADAVFAIFFIPNVVRDPYNLQEPNLSAAKVWCPGSPKIFVTIGIPRFTRDVNERSLALLGICKGSG